MANNSTNADHWIKEHFRKTQLVPYCIITVVGFLANTMVIVNGIRRRNAIRPHYSNYFVLSMTFADLGVAVMAVPLEILEYTSGIPNIGQFICKYIIQTRETFQGASIFSVSLLAFIRARQVMSYPNKEVSRRSCIILVAGIWVFSYLSCTLPLYFIYKVWPDGYCDAVWSNEMVKKLYVTFVSCAILSTMVIATISYAYVIVKIRYTLSSIPNEVLRRRNRNVTVLLISLIVSSWINYLPLSVYLMLEIYTDVHFYGLYGWSITAIFYNSRSALNPVLVLLTMPEEYRCDVQCTARKARVGALQDTSPQLRTINLNIEPNSQLSGVQPPCTRQSIGLVTSAYDLVPISEN